MKYYVKLVYVVCIFAFIFTFSSCSIISVEELLSPPKLSEEQTLIYNALTASKGSKFNLKYPKGGDYLSAFVIYDFEDNSQRHAFVFYEPQTSISSETDGIRMCFFDKTYEKWEVVCDIPVKGIDIEAVSFKKLGKDQIPVIILVYSASKAEQRISVIHYKDRQAKELLNEACVYYYADEFFLTGENLLMLVYNDGEKNSPPKADFLNVDKDFNIISEGEVELSSNASEYISIMKEPIFNGYFKRNAVILNYKVAETGKVSNRYSIDIIYKEGSLYKSITGEQNMASLTRYVTDYCPDIYPMDTDKNGIIEFPSSKILWGYLGVPNNEKLYLTEWNEIDSNGDFTRKYLTYFNINANYMFIIPEKWKNVVTAVKNSNKDCISFYIPTQGFSIENPGTPLFEIKVVSEEENFKPENNNPLLTDWKLYIKNPSGNFLYYIRRIAESSEYSLTDQEISSGFKML